MEESRLYCAPHLRGPVQAGDHPVLRPVLVVEEPAEGQTGAAAQVSEGRQHRSEVTEEKQAPAVKIAKVKKQDK